MLDAWIRYPHPEFTVKRFFFILPAVLFVAACVGSGMSGSATPEPPPFDPSGTYDVLVEVEGEQLPGTMTLSSTSEGYEGSGSITEVGQVSFSGVSVADNIVTFSVTTMYGVFPVSLTFDGDDFTGSFSSDLMSGYLSGSKRR
jgi:hypothetical protein